MTIRPDAAIPMKRPEFTKAKTKSDGVDKGFKDLLMKKAGLEDRNTGDLYLKPRGSEPKIERKVDVVVQVRKTKEDTQKKIAQALKGMNQ